MEPVEGIDIGPVGIWLGGLALQPAERLRAGVNAAEEIGFGAIWCGEAGNREAFAQAAIVLAATRRIPVALGIANIWARDAMAMANGARALAEAWPDRFILGIGVSHAPLVTSRGHQFGQPVASMRQYLDLMERAPYGAPPPARPAPIVLGALGPRMLELARDRASGAHPYFVPVEHTRGARAILGAGRLLAPEQAVILAQDRGAARAIGDGHMRSYLGLDNYRRNLLRLGYTDADVAGAGSDRLFDAVLAWGSADALVTRVRQHLEAGADHVAIHALTGSPHDPGIETLASVGEALGDLLPGKKGPRPEPWRDD